MKTKEIFMYSLGGIIVFGFFAILAYLLKIGGYESTINLLVGSLIGAYGTVVGYFYGSSKSSAEKNDIISKKE